MLPGRKGLPCPSCGFDLTGIDPSRCPACGIKPAEFDVDAAGARAVRILGGAALALHPGAAAVLCLVAASFSRVVAGPALMAGCACIGVAVLVFLGVRSGRASHITGGGLLMVLYGLAWCVLGPMLLYALFIPPGTATHAPSAWSQVLLGPSALLCGAVLLGVGITKGARQAA